MVFVRDGRIIDAGHDGRLHVLQTFKPMKRRVGLERYYFDRRIEFFKPSARPDKSSARAETGDEVSHAPAGLLPYFERSRSVMRLPVGRIVVLIGVEIEFRVLFIQAARFTNRAVRSFKRAGQD